MEYIVRPRGAGKTRQIVKRVLEDNGYLLVFGTSEKQRLLIEYPDLKDRVFVWKELPIALQGRKRKPVFIDNADYWLQELVGGFEIKEISLSGD